MTRDETLAFSTMVLRASREDMLLLVLPAFMAYHEKGLSIEQAVEAALTDWGFQDGQ